MSVRKDEKRGTWLVKLHYTNHDGETIDSTKRGFKTKAEALAWERDDLCQDFGHGSSRIYAAMGSSSAVGLVRSKKASMAWAGIW